MLVYPNNFCARGIVSDTGNAKCHTQEVRCSGFKINMMRKRKRGTNLVHLNFE